MCHIAQKSKRPRDDRGRASQVRDAYYPGIAIYMFIRGVFGVGVYGYTCMKLG